MAAKLSTNHAFSGTFQANCNAPMRCAVLRERELADRNVHLMGILTCVLYVFTSAYRMENDQQRQLSAVAKANLENAQKTQELYKETITKVRKQDCAAFSLQSC
jgi:hypothetical protein